jgi:DsbC/DsbD-like thiol-disulfide interchange protein
MNSRFTAILPLAVPWFLLVCLQYRALAVTWDQVARQTSPGQEEKQKIDVEVKLSADGVHPDSIVVAALVVKIRKGWHINSAKPADENMIATSVEASPGHGIDVAGIRYPEGVSKRFGFSDVPLDVYEGSVIVYVKLHVRPGVSPGTLRLPVDITFQACNDRICVAPATLRVDIPVRVVQRGDRVLPANEELFQAIGNR